MDALLPLTSVCRLSRERAVASPVVDNHLHQCGPAVLLPATEADNDLRVATWSRVALE